MDFTANLLMTEDKFIWVKLDPLTAAKLFKNGTCPMYEVWDEDGEYRESQLFGEGGLDKFTIGELTTHFDRMNLHDSLICIELEDYMRQIRNGFHGIFLN